MSGSINKKSRSRRNEKVLAVVIIIASTSILITVMLLGKMLGREMSVQQEVLRDQFPVKNSSATQDELEQLTTQQPVQLSRYQILLFILFGISSIVTFGGLFFVNKFIKSEN